MSGRATLTTVALDRLERALVRSGGRVARGFRPGLTETEMAEAVQPLGFELDGLHPDLRTWWGWHNGSQRVAKDGSMHPQAITWSWKHLSLQQAVEATQLKREVCSPYPAYGHGSLPWAAHGRAVMWTDRLLAVFVDVGGQVAAVDTAGSTSSLSFATIDGDIYPEPLAESLGQVVDHWLGLLDARRSPVGEERTWADGPLSGGTSFPREH